MKNIFTKLLFITTILISTVSLSATVDGNLVTGTAASSTGSTGTFDINVTKLDAVQISNLNSIVVTQVGSAGNPVIGSDSVCYYATSGNYTIRMSSSNPTPFTLVSGADSMSYILNYTETTGSDTATWGGGNLGNNVISGSFTSENKTSANCGGSTNANITVTIPAISFDNAPTGLYTDTVTITIAAN